MAELPLFSKDGKSAGTVKVDEKIFGDKVKKRLLHQVVIIYEANQREGNASTKGRGEVAGSTRKPWPQKHTGMARSGTVRSPIWRHGGIVFGPKPREYRQGITPSMRRAALDSALLGKILDKEVGVIEGFAFSKPATKSFVGLLKNTGYDRSVLAVTKANDRNAHLSVRNLPRVKMVPVAELNAYDVIKYNRVLLTREALDAILAIRKDTEKAPAAK